MTLPPAGIRGQGVEQRFPKVDDAVPVVRRYEALLAKAALPDRRFHDLRHSCASPLLARGVSLRAIQEVLGHSSCTLTANIYAHVLPELHRDVAARMDDILTG